MSRIRFSDGSGHAPLTRPGLALEHPLLPLRPQGDPDGHEAHLPAQHSPPVPEARLPAPDVDAGRPRGAEDPARAGPQAPDDGLDRGTLPPPPQGPGVRYR